MANKIPDFASEAEEQAYWDALPDSTEVVDWSTARPVTMARLKPTMRTISLRLPEHMLDQLRVLANKRDVPYQSLLKVYLAERIEEEIRGTRKAS